MAFVTLEKKGPVGVVTMNRPEALNALDKQVQEKLLIPSSGLIPALVLYKGIVCPQVHGHGPATDWTAGDQFRRHPHIPLIAPHPLYNSFIIIGSLVAGLRALPKSIISLSVEQPLLIKARKLKLVVHIGGQYKIVLALHQLKQVLIDRPRRAFIAVHHDVAAPPCPILLWCFKGIKAPGIHIPDTVFPLKIAKIPFKPFSGIGQPSRGGQSCSRADHHGVSVFNELLQPACLGQEACGRSARLYP